MPVKTKTAEISTARGLLDQIVAKLIDVATGGQPIKSADPQYKNLLSELQIALGKLGLDATIPWESLGDWRGHWRANFETYRERRDYVTALVAPTRAELERLESGQAIHDPGSPEEPTWPRLDVRIDELAAEVAQSATLDGWQDCGRRSREILVDMAKIMSGMSFAPEGVERPQAANGKAWYDLFLDIYAAGSSRSDFRKFYRATWDIAQKTAHGSVDAVEAFASAQAVILIVRLTERMLAGGPKV